MKALQLIVALLILVTVHEFGHYIFARIFGIRVNRFYLFFNPWFSLLKYYPSKGELQIIGWTKKITDEKGNETEEPRALATIKVGKPRPEEKDGRPTWAATLYGLGWVPLGGYCDIAGMVDETKSAKDLASEPQHWEFRSKAAWKRFFVMFAGVLFNFILAIIIYAGIAWHWGERTVPLNAAYEGMDFCEMLNGAGLQDGDIILQVNGEVPDIRNSNTAWDISQPGAAVTVLRNHADTLTVTMPADMLDRMAQITPEQSKSDPLMAIRIPVFVEGLQGGMAAKEAGVLEGDRILKVGSDTTPSLSEFFPALDQYKDKETTLLVDRGGELIPLSITPNSDAKIGILLRPADKIYPFEEVKYSAIEALPRGWQLGVDQLATYVSSLKILFTKSGAQQIGGFGTLGGLFPEKWNWYSFWQITAFLSVILAFMNIIPIPGLDGGHILFLLWEIATGRKASDRVLEIANTVGFCFLIALLLYANGADLFRALQ
ncbi:MAG: RIP metalloprotease RseP [Lachnospiraceae bacterium]|nr:RIP metalloprotease RseP [Lachnospiraceae bacterium]